MILVDTSGLLAAYDDRESAHDRSRAALEAARPPRILSPFVLAEVDYLVARRIGPRAELALLEEIGSGAYELAPFAAADVREAAGVCERYDDLGIGLADASIVVLARRFDVLDVLTLDERHFRSLRGPRDRPFRILPADA